MAQTCKTCKRSDVDEINKAIVGKMPLRRIMDKFSGLSSGGIQRHKERCIQAIFADVIEKKREGLLADVDEVKSEIQLVKQEFAADGKVRVALIARRLDAIEKEAKLTGAYQVPRTNDADIAEKVKQTLIEAGWSEAEAQVYAEQKYSLVSDAVN